MNQSKNQFENQNYLNIETFRRNGQGVRTPVWFVLAEGILYIRTEEESGKVKRVRKNNRVKVVPCKMDGTPIGDWVPAQATELMDSETDKFVDSLLGKKYGFQNKIFVINSKLRGAKYTVLKIELVN